MNADRRSNFALTPAERADAREALRILAGSGLKLSDAARVAIGKGARGVTPVPLVLAVERFLADRAGRDARPLTLDYYGRKLERFAEAFPGRSVGDLDAAAVEDYLASLPAGSRPVHWRAIRAFIRWGAKLRDPIATDWTARVLLARAPREHEIAFLDVATCRRLLVGLRDHPPALAAAALGLFAGIRPHELAGDLGKSPLAWEDVDTVGHILRVPAAASKTRRPRVLEALPPALWRWLAVVPPDRVGPIWPHGSRSLHNRIRTAAGLPAWPVDALRHTFATYAVAGGCDLTAVCLWLGHTGSPTLLHRHYRGLSTRADADAFWALRP